MTAQEILESQEFKKCLEFHGHLCPGLSIGYKAARAGLDKLAEKRSEDEELVAIVETDACSADAVQVMTGCTFGKGNFIYKDHGKMAFTFLSRNSGEGVRVSLKPGAFTPDEEHMALLQKVMAGRADESEKQRFHKVHRRRSLDVLDKSADELFAISSVKRELPQKAKIDASIACGSCGEPVMASKLVERQGKKLCRDCHGASHA
mgnify:CR=1 FL=1